MAKAKVVEKYGAQYRLPKPLYEWVKKEAAKDYVRPCVLVERALVDYRRRARSGELTQAN